MEEFDARTLLFLPTLIPAPRPRTRKADNKPSSLMGRWGAHARLRSFRFHCTGTEPSMVFTQVNEGELTAGLRELGPG